MNYDLFPLKMLRYKDELKVNEKVDDVQRKTLTT